MQQYHLQVGGFNKGAQLIVLVCFRLASLLDETQHPIVLSRSGRRSNTGQGNLNRNELRILVSGLSATDRDVTSSVLKVRVDQSDEGHRWH